MTQQHYLFHIYKTFFLILLFFFSILYTQTPLGNYSRYINNGRSVTIWADSSALRVNFYSDDIARVDYLPSPKTILDSSFVVVQEPMSNVSYTVNESDSLIEILESHIKIHFQKFPLRISFLDSTGNILLAEPQSGGISFNQQARTLRFEMKKDDHFYGTGERGTALDKRGQKFESNNTQIGGYSGPLPTMNLNVPFFTTTSGYALYVDNTYKGMFDFGATDSTVYTYSAHGGEVSYYFIAGKTIPEQIEKYTWLTGRQPLPPRWALGFIQSKNNYPNEQETRALVDTIRSKQFPCDAVVLDLAWFKNMGDIAWDESNWISHEKMVADFLLKGIKTILITEPYVIQPSLNFAEADKKDFFAKDSAGKTFLLEKWWSCKFECDAALLDITNPAAQQWWWSKHPSVFGKNVAGIWTDLGEPEKHPEAMMHYLGSAEKIHNIFNLLWAKTIFEGFNQLRPNERVMNLTRSGFAGIQRYGAIPWSGDVARSFGGLAVQLPMLLNMGMSGAGYHNSDIGGYAHNTASSELYIRWMQFGTFSPIARAHGAGENANGSPTEPWMFGKEAEKINREYIRLRYKLLPYIYTLAYENYKSGLPLARPLFWLDPSDKKLLNESSSYMWGDAFLVSPVVKEGERKKKIYLPKGNWINFWTDETVKGGRDIVVDAPLKQMPMFVKAGSIIPMAPVMNYSDERPLDTLTIHIYPDPKKETLFTLYEDDGKTLEYQKGGFALTTCTQKFSGDTLHIISSPSNGKYNGKLDQRSYIFEIHNVIKKPDDVQFNGKSCVFQKRYTEFRTKNNSFFYDSKLKRLFIHVANQLENSNEMVIPSIVLKTF